MLRRCPTCFCVLRFRPAPRQESLCPSELKHDFISEAQERGDWSYYRHRMNGYETYPVWGISYTCPGCGLIGTDYEPRYSEIEAQALVVMQNAAADEAERAGEPSRWREVVWERMKRAARNLTDLSISRFPQWRPCIRPFPPAPEDPAMETFEYVLVLDIPSEHPHLTDPLQVSIQSAETLIVWGDWHTHVNSRDDDAVDHDHLLATLDMVEKIVEEKALIGSLLRDGRVVAGGWIDVHEELPREYTQPDRCLRALRPDRVMVRSWRGTYDRQVFPASDG